MTAEEWANRVELCLRPLSAHEALPHSVTDHPRQYAAIVEVIRQAIVAEREACAALVQSMPLLGYDQFELPTAERTKANAAALIRARA